MRINSIIVATVFALSGCASSRAQQQPVPAPPPAAPPVAEAPPEEGVGDEEMAMCPTAVEGTSARATDIAGGVAIVFTTTTGDVAELRRRVARMAEMHQRRHGDAPARGHGHHGAMNGGMMMPAASVRVEDVEGGALLAFTPLDPADLPMLRERVHRHAERMGAGGRCPMMQMMHDEAETPPQPPT